MMNISPLKKIKLCFCLNDFTKIGADSGRCEYQRVKDVVDIPSYGMASLTIQSSILNAKLELQINAFFSPVPFTK